MAQAAAAAARFAADAPDTSRAYDVAGDILCLNQAGAQKQLAPFKDLRWIEFRVDLPKTATGKMFAFRLCAEASSR
jgi:benzoate-CoA ligase